jgi:LysM repeat protein
MGIFGKSFNEKVQDAVTALGKSDLGIRNLRATLVGRVVTLEGEAESLDAKNRIMVEFNRMVDTENTLNRIRIPEAPAAQPVQSSTPQKTEEETIYVVQRGDTLSALAQRFYGKASLYMKIFEANRDVLSNPDLIKIGQKLRIPK